MSTTEVAPLNCAHGLRLKIVRHLVLEKSLLPFAPARGLGARGLKELGAQRGRQQKP